MNVQKDRYVDEPRDPGLCGKSTFNEISNKIEEQNWNQKKRVKWWDDTKGITQDSVFVSELAREIASDEGCLADSNTAGSSRKSPRINFSWR